MSAVEGHPAAAVTLMEIIESSTFARLIKTGNSARRCPQNFSLGKLARRCPQNFSLGKLARRCPQNFSLGKLARRCPQEAAIHLWSKFFRNRFRPLCFCIINMSLFFYWSQVTTTDFCLYDMIIIHKNYYNNRQTDTDREIIFHRKREG
jgi:hypothetical protein